MSTHFRTLLAMGAAVVLAVCALAGCGSPWSDVAPTSVGEATETLGGEYGRFTLNDERVIEMRIVKLAYPFVEGHRMLGEWSTPRKVRVDLRNVSKIEVRNAS